MSQSSSQVSQNPVKGVGQAWKLALNHANYDAPPDEHFLKRFHASPYIQKVLQYAQLPVAGRILEPGCGSGKFSLALARDGYHVTTLDYVSGILLNVRKAERQLNSGRTRPGIDYCQGDIERLPFSNDTFDLVINEGVIEHWLDAMARLSVLREMVRVTRLGGVIAVIVPNGSHPLATIWEQRMPAFRNAPPMFHYNVERLRKEMAQAGLEDIAMDGIYPWRSWIRIPPWNTLYPLAAALDHWLPTPRLLRQRWGINLIGLGQKK